ncbi:MAG: DUF2779 domain-containing protein [Elusimicrobia bacterium]|nr:DUF2779 domain-containing protein [Elusimicrobiota bacterium]
MAAARLMRRHINDLAMTWHIFNSSGINISRSMLAFVDTSYTRNGDLDPEKLFKLLDVTPQVWATLPRVPQILETQQDVLLSPNEPLIFPGAHCLKPSPCSFVDSCWTALTPQDRSKAVQGVGWRDVKPLIQEGYLDLTLLSEISGIRIPKASLLEAAATKTPIINKEAIKKHLDKLVYPLHFLDFETIAPAAPIFSGTSPFETIPAQASLHIVKTPGDWSEPLHFEFITSGNTDPRPEIAQFLTSFVKAEGSIVAYNAKFEYSVLAGLAVHLPMLREALRGMMARLWDLYTPFQKGHFIHPDFRAGFSLKAIAPILAPEINYRNLKIQDGLKASIALFKLFINHDDQSKKNQLMKDLKTYCAMDTLALVQITKRLKNTFQQA